MAVYILGISGLEHDPAAALLNERGVVAAIEETKLQRSRNTSGIPGAAIQYCLSRAGARLDEVECVAVAGRPVSAWARKAWLRARQAPSAPLPGGNYKAKALGDLSRDLNNSRLMHQLVEYLPSRVKHLDHHLCHAASAFFASSLDRALVLTLDEGGDGRAGMVALGEGTRLRPIRSVRFPNSLGWVFTQVTDLLGFVPHAGEHKTQWLGLGAEPVFEKLFLKMLRPGPGKLPRLDARYFNRGLTGRVAFSAHFYREVGLDPKRFVGAARGAWSEPVPEVIAAQLAASVQQACARIVVEVAEAYRKITGAAALCVAGGVFLNAVIVSAVERMTGFERVFVQPAAGNEGTALGAAWLEWHRRAGHARLPPLEHLYLGPAYSNQEIKQVLDNCKLLYRWHDGEEQKLDEAVRLLEGGKIVAWFNGGAEFGPRALGNRSLVASPWAPYVNENLNEFIKHRESFRPFAVAVPSERAAEFFDYSPAAHFMATLGAVKPAARGLLERFLLPGDRIRLHVVERAVNPAFHRLLERFGERGPGPFLVNTSFNLFGEPLVVTPRDAVRSCFCSGIDALAIGNFTLAK
jgi:carbamoyltransferase